MKILIPILALVLLASCRSTRVIERVQVKYDSTAIRNEQALQKELQATTERYEQMLADSSGTEVVFLKDTVVMPGRVEYYPDGRLKSVEGQLQSVKQTLKKSETQLYEYADTIATLREQLKQATTSVRVEERIVNKEVKRYPWWPMLLALVAGWMARRYWPRIRSILFKQNTLNMTPLFLLGSWPVGLLLLVGAGVFFYFAHKARNSGSKWQDQRTGQWFFDSRKVPYTQIGQFWFSMICAVCFVIYLIIQYLES